MKKQTIYLSGSITKDPEYEKKFAEATRYLRKKGYKILNPVNINRRMVKRFIKKGYKKNSHKIWFACMKRNINVLMKKADVIAMLPCARESFGARIEIQLAQGLGIPVREYLFFFS